MAANTAEVAQLLKRCPLGTMSIRHIEKPVKKVRNETLDLFSNTNIYGHERSLM
jgi:uncharacterized Fe-S cluster protein YjdI